MCKKPVVILDISELPVPQYPNYICDIISNQKDIYCTRYGKTPTTIKMSKDMYIALNREVNKYLCYPSNHLSPSMTIYDMKVEVSNA